MKHLLLFILFSGSLDSFSQDTKTLEYPPKPVIIERYKIVQVPLESKPDTLRAIVLVTLSPNGIAHARMGFVVISEGKRPVYLDCQKKALKLPQVGWDFKEVGVNEKVR